MCVLVLEIPLEYQSSHGRYLVNRANQCLDTVIPGGERSVHTRQPISLDTSTTTGAGSDFQPLTVYLFFPAFFFFSLSKKVPALEANPQ